MVSSYFRLVGQDYNVRWFSFACIFIIFTFILNSISPSNGLGGNLFQVLIAKAKGTYSDRLPPPQYEFDARMTDLCLINQSSILVKVTLSAVGKLSCFIGNSGVNITDDMYPKTGKNLFFLRANRTTDIQIDGTLDTSHQQRLFCKAWGITYQPMEIRTLVSNSFVIIVESFSMITKRDEDNHMLDVLLRPQSVKLMFFSNNCTIAYKSTCELVDASERHSFETSQSVLPISMSFKMTSSKPSLTCTIYKNECIEEEEHPWVFLGTSLGVV